MGDGRVQSYSAGTEPKAVHPLAVRAMGEVALDISAQVSKARPVPGPRVRLRHRGLRPRRRDMSNVARVARADPVAPRRSRRGHRQRGAAHARVPPGTERDPAAALADDACRQAARSAAAKSGWFRYPSRCAVHKPSTASAAMPAVAAAMEILWSVTRSKLPAVGTGLGARTAKTRSRPCQL